MERLDKLIARRTAMSRKDAKKLCKWGRVSVDGQLVRQPNQKVDPEAEILVDGTSITPLPRLVMYHKPAAIISTMSDDWDRPDLSDVLPPRWADDLHPVGRLDAETTGLLLFSQDGQITQYLLHPKRAIEREYLARVENPIDEEALRHELAGGVETGEGMIPADLVEVDGEYLRLVVREGKHRMVRRVLNNAGHPVLSLHRFRYGGFELGDLPEGQLRVVEDEEMAWMLEDAEYLED